MSLRRILTLLVRELRVGPRSPLLLIGLVAPLGLTLILQLLFGSVFQPEPRLGIVDQGASSLMLAAGRLEGIAVSTYANPADLAVALGANDVDVGLTLQPDLDRAIRAGERPVLQLRIGAASSPRTRLILVATLLDLVRDVVGKTLPIDIRMISTSGQDSIPLLARLAPVVVLLAIMVCGLLIPAATLVAERESGTLSALLVTPTRLSELLISKGLLGICLSLLSGTLILWLTGGFTGSWVAMSVVLCLAALMCAELGLLLGMLAPNANTLFVLFRVAVLLLGFPAIAWFWADFPAWLGRLTPSFYFLDPLYRVTVRGAGFETIAFMLLIGLGICAALAPAVLRIAEHRLQIQT